MQLPSHHSLVFLLSLFPQAAQNIVIKLGIDSLALQDEFMVHNPVDVVENDEHTFHHAPDLHHLFLVLDMVHSCLFSGL